MADERFHRIEGQSVAEHRERVLGQLRAARRRGRRAPLVPGAVRRRRRPRRLPRPVRGARRTPTRRCRSSPACSGACSPPRSTTWAPSATTTSSWPTPCPSRCPGAFAMTETGHGSDVAAIGTTATYDAATQEFVIHTPFRAAWKDYLGNAGQHGTAAVVFARLVTQGVRPRRARVLRADPRRGRRMEFLPGVGGEDDGLKGGLNGIDNGRLWFDHVRVPRTNLLNRYGDVTPEGVYESPIDSPGRRFFTMLGTLVQGRVSLDGAAVVAARARADHRDHLRQPAPPVRVLVAHRGGRDPRLRRAPAPPAAAARGDVRGRRSRTRTCSPRSTTCSPAATTPPRRREDLETLAAALKPTSTWHALNTLQVVARGVRRCRVPRREPAHRAARRHGRLRDVRGRQHRPAAARRQASARPTTASRSSTSTPTKVARLVAERAADAARYRTPLRPRGADDRRRGRPPPLGRSAARDDDAARAAGGPRRDDGRRHRPGAAPRAEGRPGEAAALFNAHQHELVEAARAHAELVQWESFTRGARAGHRPEHPADPHVGARPVRAHAHRAAPDLVPAERSALGRPGPHGDVVHRPAAGPAAPARPEPRRRVRLRAGAPARTDRLGRRGRPARTRRAPTTGRSARPARPPSRRSTTAERHDVRAHLERGRRRSSALAGGAAGLRDPARDAAQEERHQDDDPLGRLERGEHEVERHRVAVGDDQDHDDHEDDQREPAALEERDDRARPCSASCSGTSDYPRGSADGPSSDCSAPAARGGLTPGCSAPRSCRRR